MRDNAYMFRASLDQASDKLTPQAAFEKFLQKNECHIRVILKPYRGLNDYEDLWQAACIGGCGNTLNLTSPSLLRDHVLRINW